MKKRTPVPKGVDRVNYSTRSLRGDMLDKMRLVARYRGISVEQVLNDALAASLPDMERTARKAFLAAKAKAVEEED